MASLSSQKRVLKLQKRFEYDANFNPIYIGEADRGVASSDSTWTIKKITYDTSDEATSQATAIGAWDNRGSLTYT